jgi:hypothetical protein
LAAPRKGKVARPAVVAAAAVPWPPAEPRRPAAAELAPAASCRAPAVGALAEMAPAARPRWMRAPATRQPRKCSELATQAACDIRADCHPVFKSSLDCARATPGCCTTFSKCADGAKADCAGPALCEMAPPYCEGPYAIAYTNSCYEGCVVQSDCPTPTCPQAAPTNATACGPLGYSCFYEDCAGAGRTQAVCTAGAWKVESTACTAFSCEGGGITPYSLGCGSSRRHEIG